MSRLLRTIALNLAAAAALSLPHPVSAQAPISEIVVFGDSNVDTGNLFLATGGVVAGPPYAAGRFSNGPVWVEVLAGELGLPAPAPSLVGGTNYAWGGAETGSGLSFFDTPNVGLQIDLFLADRGGLVGDELIVVAAGGNDLIWQEPFSPSQAAKKLADQIERLAAAGGRTFLIPNLFAIGDAPLVAGTADADELNTLGAHFNKKLTKELDDLDEGLDITILTLDLASVMGAIRLDPEAFGLTNVSDPACPGCGIGLPDPDAGDTVVPNPDEYLWWDFIHLTRVVHAVMGEVSADFVGTQSQP